MLSCESGRHVKLRLPTSVNPMVSFETAVLILTLLPCVIGVVATVPVVEQERKNILLSLGFVEIVMITYLVFDGTENDTDVSFP